MKFDDLAVKVNDNDGEFLLVEAAAELPDWLEPEVAENRVSQQDRYGSHPDYHRSGSTEVDCSYSSQ